MHKMSFLSALNTMIFYLVSELVFYLVYYILYLHSISTKKSFGLSCFYLIYNKLNILNMWNYANNIYDKLSTIRKLNRLSTSDMKWLLKNKYITLLKDDQIKPEDTIITYNKRLLYNESTNQPPV